MAYKNFKVPYREKDNNNYLENDNFCCGNKGENKGDGITDNEDPELNQFYYHSDHLGSSSYITNLSGNIVQHIDYVPFGEVFIEERNNKWNTPYLFNGKELDEETGLYYYGARYYSSRNSIFLSVDPLWEEKPSFSPYNYCSWNPVMRIDPDGRLDDEWEINKEGKIVDRIKNKTEDSFHVVDDKGERIEGKSIKFKYGTITDVKKPQVIVKGKPKTLTQFNVEGDEKAKNLFEFFADPSNTKVEWTHAKIGTEESGKNIVGSSHQKSSTAVGAYLRQTGYTLKEVNHNHPSGNYLPSKGDKSGAMLYKKRNSNIKLHIFTHPYRYSEYDGKGTLDIIDFGPAIKVIGTKNK